jgi:hypothetical protein
MTYLGQRTGLANQILGFQPHEMFLNSNTGVRYEEETWCLNQVPLKLEAIYSAVFLSSAFVTP